MLPVSQDRLLLPVDDREMQCGQPPHKRTPMRGQWPHGPDSRIDRQYALLRVQYSRKPDRQYVPLLNAAVGTIPRSCSAVPIKATAGQRYPAPEAKALLLFSEAPAGAILPQCSRAVPKAATDLLFPGAPAKAPVRRSGAVATRPAVSQPLNPAAVEAAAGQLYPEATVRAPVRR